MEIVNLGICSLSHCSIYLCPLCLSPASGEVMDSWWKFLSAARAMAMLQDSQDFKWKKQFFACPRPGFQFDSSSPLFFFYLKRSSNYWYVEVLFKINRYGVQINSVHTDTNWNTVFSGKINNLCVYLKFLKILKPTYQKAIRLHFIAYNYTFTHKFTLSMPLL